MKLTIGDFSEIIATIIDEYAHIGILFHRVTACGKPLGDIPLTREIEITCPLCIAEVEYRNTHPEARVKPFGTMAHLEVEEQKYLKGGWSDGL